MKHNKSTPPTEPQPTSRTPRRVRDNARADARKFKELGVDADDLPRASDIGLNELKT